MTNEPSGSEDRRAVLDAERAVNEQYLRELNDIIKRAPRLAQQVAVVHSQHWTATSLPRPGVDESALSPVIGRVELEEGHPFSDDVGDSFYIAGWRVETEDFETVNWAAPIASLFFEGRESTFEIADSVIGRRTFVLRFDDLVDYHDEVDRPDGDPFGRRARILDVPRAPSRRGRETEDARADPSGFGSTEADESETEEPTTATRRIATPEEIPSEPTDRLTRGHEAPEDLDDLRAGSAVFRVMEMPKTGRMGAVLPTMQPDQYRLVSWPGDQPLIVQGQPGTGKTVIAAHRAAYLTSREREGDRVARIAIIGPSDHYVEHVTPLISEIKEREAQIRVVSLPAVLQSIVGLHNRAKPGPIGRIESSWDLGRAVDAYVRSMPHPPSGGTMERKVRLVVESMATADLAAVTDPEIQTWLRSLPAWSELVTQTRYLPMLATIGLALNPSAAGEWVGHLIVDEAQDVRPIEWRILTQSLLERGGQLSLLGDMNQRRSDWSAPSWHQLAVDLELTDEAGHSTVEELNNGYRSTKQILRFANRLLPRGTRSERALRDGPEPRVAKVQPSVKIRTAVDAAVDMTSRHTGLVVLISLEPTLCSTDIRKRQWIRGRLPQSWTRDGHTVVVLHPDEARGLEFDAAVIVEPSDFPENVGRQGVLYTSLTRANKELAVVHSAPLPRDLR